MPAAGYRVRLGEITRLAAADGHTERANHTIRIGAARIRTARVVTFRSNYKKWNRMSNFYPNTKHWCHRVTSRFIFKIPKKKQVASFMKMIDECLTGNFPRM
jgi:hypothetical protein